MIAALVAVVLTVGQLPPSPAQIAEAASKLETAAVATAPATRVGNAEQVVPTEPPPPSPPVQEDIGFSTASNNGRCVGAEGLLAVHSPGWDVVRMSKIMYRESRCLPGADNPRSSASGLLQLLSSLHCPWLSKAIGPCNLYNADYNIRAAAQLWLRSGYGAWSL